MKRDLALFPVTDPNTPARQLHSPRHPTAFERLEPRLLLTAVVVNTFDDATHPAGSGLVSLRDAVAAADRGTSPTAITFDPRVFAKHKTIVLANGTLELTNASQPVTLTGPPSGVRISGGRKATVFLVDPGVTAALSNVLVTEGRAANYGGGIYNHGALTVTHSLFTRDVTTGDFGTGDGGGGLYSDGSVTLDHCTFTGNTSGDAGGALDTTGTATLTDCAVLGNFSRAGGAGGAGIYNQGMLRMDGCTVARNAATEHTVRSGAGSLGGGISNGGVANLTDCTIAANVASEAGGIYNTQSLSLSDCTVAANVGGGLETNSAAFGASTTLGNTIVAGNVLKSHGFFNGSDLLADVTSGGGNLIGQVDGSTGWTAADLTGTIAQPLAPRLGGLSDNGGPTPTLRPLPGSEAVAHGSVAAIPAGVTVDQRGLPRILGGGVDIGAVEVGGHQAPFIAAPPAAQPATVGRPVTLQLGSILPPASASGPYRVSVTWGDGTPAARFTVPAAGAITGPAHVFKYAGNFAPLVSVTDRTGAGSNLVAVPVRAASANGVIVVNTSADTTQRTGSPTVSLRDAVNQANATPTPVTIQFDRRAFAHGGTIKLKNDVLELSNTAAPVTIVGPASGVTLDGDGRFGIFLIDARVTATLSHLTLTRGSNLGTGAIDNSGALTMTDCVLSKNTAPGEYIHGTQTYYTLPGAGGGLNNAGTATLQDCTFSGNTATGGSSGSDLGGPSGSSTGTGGAIENTGAATLTGCTFSGNSADGAGGAIDNSGKLSIVNSTFSGNQAVTGGAINSSAGPTLLDCTLANNTATSAGGGLAYSAGPAGGSTGNTILASNTAPTGPDVYGAATSAGSNLVGKTDGSTGWLPSDLTGTVARPLDPRLGPLSDNGGFTQTLLPQPTSPALGKGSAALVPTTLATDQRGRPRTRGGLVDIGAVEVS